MADSNIARIRPTDEKSFRLAPQNVEAEQALLGAILVNNEAFYRVSDFLLAEHFYEPVHREIYEIAGKIIRAGKTATPITVKTYLPDNLIADVTMAQYLGRLAAEATTVLNAADYGQAVYDLAIRRNLIQIGEQMTATAYDADVELTAPKQIEEAEKSLFDLAEKGRYDGGFQSFTTALTDAIKMAGEAYQRDGSLSGMATGLTDLDRMMGGLQKSDLIILAGRPGSGKSSLATNIAFHIARNWKGDVTPDGHRKTMDGGQVALFSLEMSAEQLATRILAEQTEIPSSDIRRGNIHESQFARLVDVSQMLETVPLYIDDTGGLSISQLAARARRLKRQKGLDLMIIDYIQLLSGSSRKANENRVQELTEITTTLKALAKELDVPIIGCAQLSRAVEQRDDKHPQLADLRDSGSIEQDADVVCMLRRPCKYPEDEESHDKTLAILDLAKQRNGPTGEVRLNFIDELTRFENRSEGVDRRESFAPSSGGV